MLGLKDKFRRRWLWMVIERPNSQMSTPDKIVGIFQVEHVAREFAKEYKKANKCYIIVSPLFISTDVYSAASFPHPF